MGEKKTCFIVTPIGGEHEPIRRHIDGIIDAAIIPALGDKFEVSVAHRINVTGTITKQVVESIYNADLVIANLTNRNPNVMYELAIRHCMGTPLIMIADKDTSLPADIISERTIFYQNDARGVLDLRKDLEAFIEKIDYSQKSSPILDALSDIVKTNSILELTKRHDTAESDVLHYVVQKLNQIERRIENTSAPVEKFIRYISRFYYDEAAIPWMDEELRDVLQSSVKDKETRIRQVSIYSDQKKIHVIYSSREDVSRTISLIQNTLERYGFVGVRPEQSNSKPLQD